MVKMVRQKTEYVCSKCGKTTLKWQGLCPSCGSGGTMELKVLIPTTVKPKASTSQKAIIRRAKNSERNIARRMLDVDGADPVYKNVTSSTGRVGHITGMQIDAVSANYVTENKNRTMPMWLNKAWIQIVQRAQDFNKHALLHIEPSNIAKEYILNGMKKRTPTMAIITQDRHEDLIKKEKALGAVTDIVLSNDSNVVKIRKLQDLL